MKPIVLFIVLLAVLVAAGMFGGRRADAPSDTLVEPVAVISQSMTTITFPSRDDLTITADLYEPESTSRATIVAAHQARWSRSEYRQTAERLAGMGFRVLAIDQRSGGEVNEVVNATHQAAEAANLSTQYVDARPDLVAAVQYARTQWGGSVILVGSSYSSSLSLQITGTEPGLVDAVAAFSPGEYFTDQGQTASWVTESATGIAVPTFITSAADEVLTWEPIAAGIQSDLLTTYEPADGQHGSRALWSEFADSEDLWAAFTAWLDQVAPSN